MKKEAHKKIKPPKCPVCEDTVCEQYRPFCSKRCASIDLGRWLTGRYVVSGSEDSDEDGSLPGHDAAYQSVDDDETSERT